jgi:hypothetical protein
MESCLDHAKKATALQTMGDKMGAEQLRQQSFTQKWLAKSCCCSKPLEAKPKKTSFFQLAKDCLDPAQLTKEKARSFGKQAQSCTRACCAFEHTNSNFLCN